MRTAPEFRVSRVWTLGAVGLVVLCAGYVAIALRLERNEVRERWRVRLNAIADDRSRALESWAGEQVRDACVIASFPSVRQALGGDPGAVAHVGAVLASTVKAGSYAGAQIADAAGRVLATVGTPLSAGTAGAAGAVELVPGPGHMLAIASCSVPDVGSSTSGFVAIGSDPTAHVYPLLRHEATPTVSGESLLVRRDGDSVLYLSPLRHRGDPPGSLHLSALPERASDSALAGSASRASFVDYRGVPVLAVTRLITGTNWGLVVKVDLSEVDAEAVANVRWSTALVAVLYLALAGLAFGVTRGQRLRLLSEIARNDARYRAVTEQGNDGALFVRPGDGRILEANRAAEKLYGRTQEELRSMTVLDLRPPEEHSAARENLAAAHSGLVFQATHLRKDGSPIPVEVSSRGIEIEDQTLFFSQVRDVSKRKAAEARILALNRLLKTVLAVNELIVREEDPARLLEATCRILVENGGFLMAWFGAPDPATGRVVAVASAGPFEGYLEAVEITLDGTSTGAGPTGRAIRDGVRVVADDWETDASLAPWLEAGRRRGIRSSICLPVPLDGTDGAESVLTVYSERPHAFDAENVALLEGLAADLRFALTARDVQRREADARQALERSEERYRSLVEASQDLVWSLDPEGRVTFVNQAALPILGYEPHELRGRAFDEIAGAGNGAPDDAMFLRLLAAGRVIDHPNRLRHRSGADVFLLTSGVVRRDAAGDVLEITGTSKDVTERRKLEEQLRQAQKMEAVGQLAGGVAHDFNNLLTAISGFGMLAQRSLSPTDPIRSHIDEVLAASDRAAILTRQLLTFSRRQPVEAEPLDLSRVVRGVEKMLRRVIGESIELLTRLEDGLPAVKADPGQIEQVLMNLLVNARDAMPHGGVVTVETRSLAGPGDARVALEVRDTGTGMDEGTRAHLFEPFFTTKERGKGTGLGLATVYGIVTQCGGEIAVDTAPGQGTRFVLSFPVSPETPAAASQWEGAEPETTGSGTILLVEDEPGVRELTRRLLAGFGYQVLVARDGSEAIDMISEAAGTVRLLISDVVMPGLSGPQLARQLLQSHPDLRVLFISGYARGQSPQLPVPPGHVSFLAKPFGIPALARAVRELMEAR